MTFGRRVGVSIWLPRGLSLLLLLGSVGGCDDARRVPSQSRQRTSARPTAVVPSTATAPTSREPSSGMDAQAAPVEPPMVGGGGGGAAARPDPLSSVRIAALGDYGDSGWAEERVAELVAGLEPDFIVTTGDNNYPIGAAETIDQNIGLYYSDFIFPYRGVYGSSATENRFFPTLGNHDWGTPGAQPHLDYFTLPGNERYYDIVLGDVHFFAIDSDPREPDGIAADSVQAQWLKRGLAESTSAFDVVAMHHPPYSSGPHGNTPALQWPYAQWGAELVLAGHDHCYERIERDGITYAVSGLGGRSIYSFGPAVEGSLVRYNEKYGVALIEADSRALTLSFVSVDNELIDTATIEAR